MKKLYLVLVLVLSIGFVVAHGIYSNMDGGLKSDNVFDYKYDKGDFVKKDFGHKYDKDFGDWDKKYDYHGKGEQKGRRWKRDKNEDRKKVRYDYVPHMRKWKKTSCYDSPPAGKLFYIGC